jgi:hypothetical protein
MENTETPPLITVDDLLCNVCTKDSVRREEKKQREPTQRLPY